MKGESRSRVIAVSQWLQPVWLRRILHKVSFYDEIRWWINKKVSLTKTHVPPSLNFTPISKHLNSIAPSMECHPLQQLQYWQNSGPILGSYLFSIDLIASPIGPLFLDFSVIYHWFSRKVRLCAVQKHAKASNQFDRYRSLYIASRITTS